MEAPKCKSCGKRHWGLCSTETVPPAPLPDAVHGDGEAPPGGHEVSRRLSKGGHTACGGTGRKSPEDIGRASEEKACRTAAINGEGADAVAHEEHRPKSEESTAAPCLEQVAIAKGRKDLGADSPLTPSQRQKRYRDKLGDEYRKRNRERMRKARNG